MSRPIGIRWTIGDVSQRGFSALRYSIIGAWRLFGEAADFAVMVNGLASADARQRCGELPCPVAWRQADFDDIPGWLMDHLAGGLAEGVAWKFAPLRLFPERHELALDNDCILWDMPAGIGAWLARRDTCLLAEDVMPAFGKFAGLCGTAPRNTGIRGLPPGFDLASAMRGVLAGRSVVLDSELDEQGLQVAALSADAAPQIVTAREVTICSPNPPHSLSLGVCGAHFVGLNVRRERPYCDASTLAAIAAHWDRHEPMIARKLSAASRKPLEDPKRHPGRERPTDVLT